jgi:hypothetical protein
MPTLRGRINSTVTVYCCANEPSACPVRANRSIEAEGIIPISDSDVAGIPPVALVIPDFEGQAILRIFSNSTQAEMGCFAAQITNGNTFSQKSTVGSVLGVFTFVAVLASFATAIYGDSVVEMRKHYAHSLSVMIVFAVWHHIYFTGALSMNWPSALVAFWSNYAWAGGMIYSEHMQNTINDFIGWNKGNTSHVGAAGTGVDSPNLGGGYDLHAIYKRNINSAMTGMGNPFGKRDSISASSNFRYDGRPVRPGLPLPGNYSGFAGTLAPERIPASNAFMTGLLWYLILIACVVVSMLAFKVMLEGLSGAKIIRRDRLAFFREHFVHYMAAAVLRTAFIGFFMIAYLSMFQFAYLRSPGPVAVACVVFVIIIFGVGTAAGLACYCRVSHGKYICEPDVINIEKRKAWKIIPSYGFSCQSQSPRSEDKAYAGAIPWWLIRSSSGEKSVHDDENFTMKFGWLASRYRRTRWWFFAVWLVYEFIRACFLAGASSQSLVQVCGLFVVEFIAFVCMVCLHPFEGQRLNIVLVYLLGLSKVATTGLSAAFDTRFGLSRIPATVIGIIIILIQGVLTLVVMIAIFIGAITSYMSITRNREDMRPKRWLATRQKYFDRIDANVHDVPRPRPTRIDPVQEVDKGPYFSVNLVKRIPKVEDEDRYFMPDLLHDPSTSNLLLSEENGSRTDGRLLQRDRSASLQSQVSSSTLPRAARLHRPSWNSQELDSRGTGRQRAVSDTLTSTLNSFNGPMRPRLNTLPGNPNSVERRPSPLSEIVTCSETPDSSFIPHPYDNGASPVLRPASRPTVPSRASSRPLLEAREEVSPIPRKSSIRVVLGNETTQ